MDPKYAELLKNKEVIEEINRHKWIESQKAGRDIGFEKATEDWLKRFANAWLQYHAVKPKGEIKKENSSKSDTVAPPKTRRARSYLV